jgi:tellurite resistance protein TerC
MSEYWPIVMIVLQLVFLEGILSIDNAAVIGALVSPLPDNQPVVWPNRLKRLGEWLHPILGNQRLAALRVGILGAYVGRGAMLFLASFLIYNSWVRLVGAAYLIHLAFDNLGEMTGGETEDVDGGNPIKKQSFWSTVLTVEIMDLIFSIDNVIAAVSLSNKIWVVMLGVAIGILTMRFAAGVFSYAVEREPILRQAAYILVLNIGIQLILEQIWKVEISDLLRFGISMAIILFSLAYAHIRPLQKLRSVLIWLAQGIGIMNELIDWILVPVKALFQWLISGIRFLPGLRST